jgi:metallo-beta-lactamase family protein
MNVYSPGGCPGPTVTFWGAAQSVTGSMHLVEVGGRKLLLDCGRSAGARNSYASSAADAAWPVDPHRRAINPSSASAGVVRLP